MKSVQILTILYFTAIVFTLAAGQYNETLCKLFTKIIFVHLAYYIASLIHAALPKP